MWASTTDDNAVYEQSDKRMCQLINIRGTSPEMLSAGKDAKEEHYDYKAELKETLSLTDRAYEKLLYITDAMDLDDRVPDRLEEAMECLSNAVSILEEAVEDEESRW